jgi:hypothetical protein
MLTVLLYTYQLSNTNTDRHSATTETLEQLKLLY